MIGHALWSDKCSNHFHEDDGWYPLTIHQYFCSGVSWWHSHLQQYLGRTLVVYSAGSAHSVATQTIWKLGKMLLWHGQGPLLRIHHWSTWCACGSNQNPGNPWLASPNHTHWASELLGPCQFLSQVRVGILPYCMGPQPSDQGWCQCKVRVGEVPTTSIQWFEVVLVLVPSTFTTIPATTLWDQDRCFRLCCECRSNSKRPPRIS